MRKLKTRDWVTDSWFFFSAKGSSERKNICLDFFFWTKNPLPQVEVPGKVSQRFMEHFFSWHVFFMMMSVSLETAIYSLLKPRKKKSSPDAKIPRTQSCIHVLTFAKLLLSTQFKMDAK